MPWFQRAALQLEASERPPKRQFPRHVEVLWHRKVTPTPREMPGISSRRAALQRGGESRLRPATVLFTIKSFIFNSRAYVTALAVGVIVDLVRKTTEMMMVKYSAIQARHVTATPLFQLKRTHARARADVRSLPGVRLRLSHATSARRAGRAPRERGRGARGHGEVHSKK